MRNRTSMSVRETCKSEDVTLNLCIRFEVPDVEAACKRFEDLGVQFVKKPNDGRMKGLAFIKVSQSLSV